MWCVCGNEYSCFGLRACVDVCMVACLVIAAWSLPWVKCGNVMSLIMYTVSRPGQNTMVRAQSRGEVDRQTRWWAGGGWRGWTISYEQLSQATSSDETFHWIERERRERERDGDCAGRKVRGMGWVSSAKLSSWLIIDYVIVVMYLSLPKNHVN